jgi:phage terminase Nu1 subunit (DNA packaging protein)
MVTSAEIQAHTGVSDRTIRQWQTDGIIPDTDSMSEIVKAIIAYFKGQMAEARRDRTKTYDEDSQRQQQVRLTRAKAEKLELENQVRAGELVEADEATLVWSGYISACKARLLGIPVRVALELAGLSDPKEIQAILTESIDEALIELSNGEFVQRLEPAGHSDPDLQTTATADG